MAYVQVTSATLKRDGTLTVSGSGFTRTSTTVKIDGETHPFTINDDGTELTLEEVAEGARKVRVSKSGIARSATISSKDKEGEEDDMATKKDDDDDKKPAKTATRAHTPGDVSKDDQTSDVDPEELNEAANRGGTSKQAKADARQMEKNQPNREPLKEGEHLPGDFRSRVENTAAGDLNMDPREPYPTGNPPDPRETFYRMYGYYKDDADDAETPNPKGAKKTRASQLDADPKT